MEDNSKISRLTASIRPRVDGASTDQLAVYPARFNENEFIATRALACN